MKKIYQNLNKLLNFQKILIKVKVYNNYIDENVVKKAYDFAFDVHKNQKRLSGYPYITHPIAVAAILCDLKVDTATIITALLHDTIEDTEATYNEVNKLFGKEIADLVEGVTKISRLEDKSKEYSVAENFRKLILATSKDIRVLLVKLADRLHNMRTINNITNPDKRLRIAKETMEIYSPLAERMGMHNFRDELEDLAFNGIEFSMIPLTSTSQLLIIRLKSVRSINSLKLNDTNMRFHTIYK